jgi:hypothetical protein
MEIYIRFLKDLKKLLLEVQLSQVISKQDLWIKLSALGYFDLVQKLRHVERQTSGYNTIIVPPTGFVHDPKLNDSVIKWLRHKHVNVFDVNKRVKEMAESLVK